MLYRRLLGLKTGLPGDGVQMSSGHDDSVSHQPSGAIVKVNAVLVLTENRVGLMTKPGWRDWRAILTA